MSHSAQALAVSTPGPTDCDRVWQLASSIGAPFASPDNGRAYVRIAGGPWVLPIRSPEFRELIRAVWLTRDHRPPREEHLRIARSTLSGQAWFGGESTRRVHLRIAPKSGGITLDLANGRNQFVRITRDDWSLATETESCFLRPQSADPLPVPRQPSSPGQAPALDRIRELLRIPRLEWPRVLAWLLAALNPGPESGHYTLQYPILALHGPAESGTSTAAICLRSLIDPNTAGFLNHQRTEMQVLRLALSGWVIAYDGIERLTGRLQGILSRISSGAGYNLRDPGDSEPYSFFIARPQIVTMRTACVTAASSPLPRDSHRTLAVQMDTIPLAERRTRNEIFADFAGLAPLALGELCAAVSAALAADETALPGRRLVCLDTAIWAIAGASALNVNPTEMSRALEVPPKPIVAAVERLLSAEPVWKGSPTALAAALPSLPGVPANPIALSRLLIASSGELAEEGIQIEVERSNGKRRIILSSAGSMPDAAPEAIFRQPIDAVVSSTLISKAQAA